MTALLFSLAWLLPHRIGDLEKSISTSPLCPPLPHRIGDLETINLTQQHLKRLPHRIGDLEIEAALQG